MSNTKKKLMQPGYILSFMSGAVSKSSDEESEETKVLPVQAANHYPEFNSAVGMLQALLKAPTLRLDDLAEAMGMAHIHSQQGMPS